MDQEKAAAPKERFGVEKWSRGGGQPEPQTPSGKVKKWQPPTKGTAPANRKERNANQDA